MEYLEAVENLYDRRHYFARTTVGAETHQKGRTR